MKMLKKNAKERITAEGALKHDWISNNTDQLVINEEIRSDALKELG